MNNQKLSVLSFKGIPMSDDPRYPNRDAEHDDSQPGSADQPEPTDPPASVVFMEMMRQAAARQQPDTGPHAFAPDMGEYAAQSSAEAAAQNPPTDTLEAQRVRRVQRRQARRRRRTVGMLGGLIRSLLVVVVSAGLMATILSWWTSPQSLNPQLRINLEEARATSSAQLAAPSPMPTPNWLRRIGIVSGHLGPENDPGAVCPDGLTETEINFAVAQLVVLDLRGRGYSVDLLEEFDDRLGSYRAEALVSIHANDCRDYGEHVSGYLVGQALVRPEGGSDTRLRECVADHYGVTTGLERRFTLTRDMDGYHIFNKIHLTTPAIIIEMGFMRADREILTTRPDLLARGVVDGILCFLEPGELPEEAPDENEA
jgi:N-acetylmuramoyl-L-alanine amidase